MPVTDWASYPPTMDEFIAHWSAVNMERAALGEPPLRLRCDGSLEEFVELRDQLVEATRAFTLALAREQECRAALAYCREAIRSKLVQFRTALPAGDPLTERLESATTDFRTGRWLATFPTVVERWRRMDETGPSVLPDGSGLAEFQASRSDLHEAAVQLRAARRRTHAWFRERWGWIVTAMYWMTDYRCVVRFDIEVSRELLHALPARLPGSYRPRSGPAR